MEVGFAFERRHWAPEEESPPPSLKTGYTQFPPPWALLGPCQVPVLLCLIMVNAFILIIPIWQSVHSLSWSGTSLSVHSMVPWGHIPSWGPVQQQDPSPYCGLLL